MLLRDFQVFRFRNVIDSEPIPVETDVTCLVGKNESGKTALLQALELLNPARPLDFNIPDQYPRWLLADDRKAGSIESVVAVQAAFDLEEADLAAVEEVVGSGTFKGSAVTVTRDYGGEPSIELEVDEAKAVAGLVKAAGASPALRKRLNTESVVALTASIADVREAAERAEQEQEAAKQAEAAAADPVEGEDATEGAEEGKGAAASQATSTPASADALLSEAEVEQLATVESAVAELLADEETLDDRVAAVLLERLPKFFYFSDYSILPGRVDLNELAGGEPPASSELQTAWALLQLASTDTSLVGTEDFELRQAELEAVANKLTKEVSTYWTQNPDLWVSVVADQETVEHPSGPTAVVRFLDFRVTDRRHNYSNNFSQRSSGFKWFFSFLAAFSEFEEREERVIVLLDEPALTLHARAQADFLRFIEERLATTHQVVYTTHSPFMVETGRLERVRIVEDKGPDVGVKVTTEVMATERDSLFPLQAALGYDIAQSLFVGADNLLVEGTSDFTYLTLMSELLASQGRTALDPRWHILPCGGATNIATFVALLGGHLEVTVLVDSGTKGIQRLVEMGRSGQLEPTRLITVGATVGRKNADIEDLFEVDDYLAVFNPALKQKLKASDLPEGDRIVKRLADKLGGDFEHGQPADYLLRHRDEILPTLSETTLDNFERLIEVINTTLPAE